MDSSSRQPDHDNGQPPSPHRDHGKSDHTPARFIGLSALMFWGCIVVVAIAVIVILGYAL
jgi:hypothetical protein